MKAKQGLALLLILLVIGGTIAVAVLGLGSSKQGSIKEINLGLDLAGGVSITYTTEKSDPSKKEIDDTIFKIKQRLDQQGFTESDVYKEGSDRINVDIPGAKDANKVLESLGSMGDLKILGADGEVIITGADIKDAQPMVNTKDGSYEVSLKLNDSGIDKFAKGTTANVGKNMPIVYDGQTISAPTVNEPITGGVCSITNIGDSTEANNLATYIRIGALPLKLVELRSNVVGAKLGQEAISTSLLAGIVGLILVMLFMISVYRLPGFASSIALAFYAAMMIVIVSSFDLTLTLPGIAGIILSIGMAVDANVIIFARIREEVEKGKTLRAAVKAGFHKALSAIIDGNVTTLIAAGVLFWLGSGTVKGFAQTLAIGIMVSMFTALFVTRVILYAFIDLGIQNKAIYGMHSVVFKFDYIKHYKKFFIASISTIVIGLLFMGVNQITKGSILNYDVEFSGGTSTLVSVGKEMTLEQINADINAEVVKITGDTSPDFNAVKGKGQFVIKTKNLDAAKRLELETMLTTKYSITSEDIETQTISATISNEMRLWAILSVIAASLLMLIYIAIRFSDFSSGISAIIALLHDIQIVFVVYIMFGIPINNSFIAAILTILGYSINDTIITFDRIRENKDQYRNDTKSLINISINQTLGRSINTTLTTLITVVVLYILGFGAIRDFAIPMMIGIVSGAYSSIFIASPIWYLFKKRESAKNSKRPVGYEAN